MKNYTITKFDGILSQTVEGIEALYDKLFELVEDELEVIKAVSWSEFASVGDEYKGDYFDIAIAE